uniref:Uncharacterized protein n=1 Tax=Glossina brevipalpis TaxID=37001 RepID=A0A1A9WZ58_9MUSC
MIEFLSIFNFEKRKRFIKFSSKYVCTTKYTQNKKLRTVDDSNNKFIGFIYNCHFFVTPATALVFTYVHKQQCQNTRSHIYRPLLQLLIYHDDDDDDALTLQQLLLIPPATTKTLTTKHKPYNHHHYQPVCYTVTVLSCVLCDVLPFAVCLTFFKKFFTGSLSVFFVLTLKSEKYSFEMKRSLS